MVLSKDQQQLRDFLKETIPFLCKSRLDFRSKFTVEAIIGVTVDESDLFYVSLNEDVSAEVVPKLILERPAGTSQFQKVEGLIDHTLVDVAGDEEYHPKKKKKKTALKRGRKRPGSPLLNMSVDEGDMTSNLDSTEIDLDFIKTEMAEPDFESALDDSFIDKSELDDSALDPLPGTSAGPSLLKDGVEDDGDYSDEGGLDDYSGGDHSDQDGTFDSAKDVEASGSIPAKSDNDLNWKNILGRLDISESCDSKSEYTALENIHKPSDLQTKTSHLVLGARDLESERLKKGTAQQPSELQLHTKAATFNKQVCKDCKCEFPNKQDLAAHVKLQHAKNHFVCEQCGRVFKGRASLYEHKRRLHDARPRYSCEHCPKGYMDKSNFMAHVNSHLNIKEFKCVACQKDFGYRQSYKLHVLTCHGGTKYTCEYCGCAMNRKDTLRAHIKALHTPQSAENEHKCPCGKSFKWRQLLGRHRKKCAASVIDNS